jgi:hypothetical protein
MEFYHSNVHQVVDFEEEYYRLKFAPKIVNLPAAKKHFLEWQRILAPNPVE